MREYGKYLSWILIYNLFTKMPKIEPFKRKIYDGLLEWKNRNGECAILIEGARRVGKSTIVEEFARREYRSYLMIDFTRPLEGTIETFERFYHDVDQLISNLGILYGVELFDRESLIIFDEVQHYPRARQLIKYLVLNGRYDYAETGSLISIKKNVEKIQIPSEEHHIDMYPMDFEEFLWAQGDEVTVPHMRKCFEKRMPLGDSVHSLFMERYKTYMMVGGMPQAVDAYRRTHSVAAAEAKKREILTLYRNDMGKIPVGNGTKARFIFDLLPSMLSLRKKTFRPGMVRESADTSDYMDSIVWLKDAGICNICCSNSDPNIALNLSLNPNSLKCYAADTGLLMTLSFDMNIASDKEVYLAFLKGRLSVNEGMFFENMVGQELKAAGHKLRFSEFYVKGDKKHPYEVDFVLSMGRKITPIEVKSGMSSRHRSLDVFMEKYHTRISEAFVIHGKDLRVDGKMTYIPIYMTMFL